MARRRRLGEILVGAGLIDEFQLRSALSDQKRWGRPLGMTLVRLGFVEEDELLAVLSRQLDVPVADLHGKRIAPHALARIPVEVAEQYHCLPLFVKREGGRDTLYLGMEDPTNLGALDELSFRTGLQLKPVLVGPSALAAAIERYYHKLGFEGEDEPGEPDFESPIEPGDTAPLIFSPAPPAPRVAAAPEPGDGADGPPSPAPAELPALDDFAPYGELELDEDESTLSGLELPSGSPSEAGREATAPPAPEREKPREVPTRAILRAVTQLLIEKGVLDRGELLERIRALSGSHEA